MADVRLRMARKICILRAAGQFPRASGRVLLDNLTYRQKGRHRQTARERSRSARAAAVDDPLIEILDPGSLRGRFRAEDRGHLFGLILVAVLALIELLHVR
jgi:hypothetical protein